MGNLEMDILFLLTCPVAACCLPLAVGARLRGELWFSICPLKFFQAPRGWYIKACHPYTERKSRTPGRDPRDFGRARGSCRVGRRLRCNGIQACPSLSRPSEGSGLGGGILIDSEPPIPNPWCVDCTFRIFHHCYFPHTLMFKRDSIRHM